MSIQTIEIEAATVEEAQAHLQTRIPDGCEVFSTEVLADGKAQTVTGRGETLELAYADAARHLPAGAEELARRDIRAPTTSTLALTAYDDAQARRQVYQQMAIGHTLKTVVLVTPGKTGFLGLGRTPHQYQAEILAPAVVEISFRRQAKIVARVGPPAARTVGLAEALAGGWPTELPRTTFDGLDLEAVVARVQRYLTMPHPASVMETALGLPPHYPTYKLIDGKIGRESSPLEDVKLVTTAAMLTGRGHVTPLDQINSRLALEIIERYVGMRLAKFVFSLPRAHALGAHGEKLVVIEAHLIDIYKGVENVLFEIYEELGSGETFNDQTVTRKLLAIVKG